ncbi:Hemerythrin-like domain-containing protein [Actinacidiphila alni]|uniref:Hemerythrin-like domain-containing protein n=1 Tax=Actinacidiphila alni TaxID=380248 RepID=A0A1I2DAG5_9ACTN|nr:hemerythrin domain-containing protein [Actinacidiphila alni]SFE77516.1 Hemerythrin-like domain-containing protein [Actinacidiphila alni]
MTTPHQPGEYVDLTMMYAFHDGLRRDVAIIAKSAAVTGDDPTRLTATHFGWDLFKRFLTIHHSAEDDVLWPKLRGQFAGRDDDLELLDAMEAEHDRIDPLIAAIDAALADQEGGHAGLGDTVDAFATEINAHLTHEEDAALPLIERELSPADWALFADSQRNQIGLGLAPRYIPWLLDGATPERTAEVLAIFPPPLAAQYRNAWKQQYAELNPWSVEYGKA